MMLKVSDQLGGEQQVLIELGEKLFPTYQRILDSADVSVVETTRIFSAIQRVQADRGQFLDRARIALGHENGHVQRAAIQLIARIGSARDTAPLAVLLAAKDRTISYAAAKALSEIGDRPCLIALDIWLSSDIHREYTELRDHVRRFRAALEARLDRTAPPPREVKR